MDVLIKGVPEEIGETQFREWCSIIVERFENAKLNQIKEVVQATEAAKSGIDGFRVANALKPKFAKVEEVVEAVEPEVKEEPKVEDAEVIA
jgi:hypothetical protein